MNYKLHYKKLINKARNRDLRGYTETHHIIPRCMNGSDDKDNLVRLTAREHFIAHILLVKIYPKQYGLIKAVQMMTVGHIEHRNNNRMYGWLKEKFSEEISRMQTGEGNSQFGTIWVHSLEEKLSKKIKKDELQTYEDLGWIKGRKIDFDLKVILCRECNTKVENRKGNFCSDKCKTYFKSPHYRLIDDNKELLIEMFKDRNSIDKTLRDFGIVGKRLGNQYFSDILKEREIKVLKRRNS